MIIILKYLIIVMVCKCTVLYNKFNYIHIMNEEVREVIGVEHLKTVLSTLTPEDIVKHAYKEWYPCQRTGHTILNLENGKIYGLGIELNQLPLVDTVYIELYSIDWEEDPIEVEELFSPQEYEEYLEFKDDEVCEYTPDIVSDFCQKKGIDENERKIGLLAYKFEKNEQSNYNQWESKILNKYYDVIMDDYNPFKQMDNDF